MDNLLFPQHHSSMSSSSSVSEPEWDVDGQYVFTSEDVPSLAVYLDILTDPGDFDPEWGATFDPEWGAAAEQDLFRFTSLPSPAVYADILTTVAPQHVVTTTPRSPVPSPTPLTALTRGSSSQQPDVDAERSIAEEEQPDAERSLAEEEHLDADAERNKDHGMLLYHTSFLFLLFCHSSIVFPFFPFQVQYIHVSNRSYSTFDI